MICIYVSKVLYVSTLFKGVGVRKMEQLYNLHNMVVVTDSDNVFWWNIAVNEDEIRDHPYALQLVLKDQIMRYHSIHS